MDRKLVLLLFAAISSVALTESAPNVLVVDSVGSPSHQVWWHRFAYALADHGYNVTMLSCKIIERPSANLHPYHLHNFYELPVDDSGEEMNYLDLMELGTWEKLYFFQSFLAMFDEMAMEAKGFKEVMEFPTDFKFDLIIYDFVGPAVFHVLADRFPGAKLIAASAYPGVEYSNRLSKAPNLASFVPNMYLNDMPETFKDRLESFVIYMVEDFLLRYYLQPSAEKVVRKTYKLTRSVAEIADSTQLVLINYHPSISFLSPVMPGVIPVGGLQIADPKPLPKDLEEIFAGAKNGVVLFSLGSNVKSETMGSETLNKIISALAELSDYTFLWKIDTSKLSLEIPKNVFIRKWLPQNDILADNRTKLFMSHAGGLSSQECIWYGQPMLALPVMADQVQNAAMAVKKGIALQLNIKKMDKETLKATILEMLENKKYIEAARLRSRNFRDQKETPIERALWWVDYIARNDDVSFLKSPKLEHMNYFVKHSVDVIAFLTIFVLLLICGILKIVCIISKCLRKKEKKMKVQ